MIQIRIHGRGGQGVVTAAELIAIAAFKDGKEAQAFPSFGVERTGAPVESYVRIDDRPIITREQVYEPDILIILDSSLLDIMDVTNGATKKTSAVINTTKDKTVLKIKLPAANLKLVDASKIALETIGRNLVNTVILGAFAKASGLISLVSLEAAVKEKFAGREEIIEKNLKAVKKAYER